MSDVHTAGFSEDRLREIEAAASRRIAQMERAQERLFRRLQLTQIIGGVALSLAAVLSVLTIARTQPGHVVDRVEAHEFVLRGADGQIRAALVSAEDGSTRLSLNDSQEQARLRFTVLPDGSPGVSFADRSGRTRAVLGLLPDQTTSLVFADEGGKTRAVLGYGSDAARLIFVDRDGLTRATVGVSASGEPELTTAESVRPAASPPTDLPLADAPAPDSASTP